MTDKGKILWQEFTSPELGDLARDGASVIVPVGSIEQHGPHLPVSTDIIDSLEIAKHAAQQIDEFPVLVAPPIWWGVSPHHMAFPGTISLSTDTFIALLSDVCRSIASHGFQRIFVLNGHGGNANLVNVVAQRLTESESPVWIATATWSSMTGEDLKVIAESDLGGTGHAGEMETSLQLHLQPQLVQMERAIDEPRTRLTSFFKWDVRAPGTVYYPRDMKRDTQHGTFGIPSLSSAEKGERIFEAAVDRVVAFLKEYQAMSVEETDR